MFRGRFEVKLDSKSRLGLPASIRSVFESKKKTKDTTLVITNSLFRGEKCLDVYSLKSWEALEKRISKLPSLDLQVQSFQRFYLSGGQVVSSDSQNRILIPQNLRKFAGLKEQDELIIVGMGEKFEVWSAEKWNLLFNDLTNQYEGMLEALAKLEKGES